MGFRSPEGETPEGQMNGMTNEVDIGDEDDTENLHTREEIPSDNIDRLEIEITSPGEKFNAQLQAEAEKLDADLLKAIEKDTVNSSKYGYKGDFPTYHVSAVYKDGRMTISVGSNDECGPADDAKDPNLFDILKKLGDKYPIKQPKDQPYIKYVKTNEGFAQEERDNERRKAERNKSDRISSDSVRRIRKEQHRQNSPEFDTRGTVK